MAGGAVLLAVVSASAGSFSQLGTLPMSMTGRAAVMLGDGRVLATGGVSLGSLASVHLYDPATDQWSSASAMAQRRQSHSATVLGSGKVLVVGGVNNNLFTGSFDWLSHVETYDPSTQAWTPAAAMSGPRASHTVVLLANGKVLVAGGAGTSSATLASAELYDPTTDAWSSAGSMVQARWAHTAVLLPSGKVLVTGGFGASGAAALSSAEIYDPATNSWSAAYPMANARANHTATVLPDGKVLVAGGQSSSYLLNGPPYPYQVTGSVEQYDAASNVWTAAAPLLFARGGHSASLLASGRVLIAGGGDATGYSIADAELYFPASNGWLSVGSAKQARYAAPAFVLGDQRVLFVGREWSSSETVERYDPGNSADCLFDWVELSYPELFAPAGSASSTAGGYYFRSYARTQSYVGTRNERAYYLVPALGSEVRDAGAVSGRLATAGCPD
jgi:hypothetical protein